MSQPFWTSPEWNNVTIGDVTLPGLQIVRRFKCGSRIEKTQTKGRNQAALKDHGQDPAPITIEVILATREHWDAWVAVVPRILPRKEDATKHPKDIVYPDLTLLGIKSVVVESIEPEPPTSSGAKRYIINCVQWVPEPKKKVAQSKSSLEAAPKGTLSRPAVQKTAEQLAFTPTGLEAMNRVFDAMGPPPEETGAPGPGDVF